MKIQKFLIALGLFFSVTSYGQNARFSQLWSAPMQFNPSLTGRFDGKVRLGSLYSSQQSDLADMNHLNIGVDAKFGPFKTNGDEKTPPLEKVVEGKDEVYNKAHNLRGYWGAGINYYQYGHNKGPFSAQFVSASLARHFYNKSNKFYGFGVQATYASGNLDETKGTAYDKEISGGGFRFPTPSGSLTPGLRKGSQNYMDFNAGGYYGMNTEAVMFELGGAMYHLFYPKNDAMNLDEESKLRHRVTAYSLLRLKFNPKWGIIQRNMYWQEGLYLRSKTFSDSMNIVDFWSGLEFYKINPAKNINLNFGFYTRSFRTMMPFVNLNLGKYATIRGTYEQPINSKKYNAYSAQRAEVSLILNYGRETAPGTRFYKKTQPW
jgi:hypothetical protein